jgi:hypothetical protein
MNSRFGPRTTRAPRASRLPIATSEWPETSDQREQAVEVGGQVDVHVRQDRSVGGGPDGVHRAPAALLLQVDDVHARQVVDELVRHLERAVGAGVVGDRDPEGVGERPGQVRVQPAHAAGQVGLLVVHRTTTSRTAS